jgi:hypothetical protein
MIEMTGVQFLVETGIILSAITYRPVVDFSQPPVRWISLLFPEAKIDGGLKLSADLHLVPRSRVSGVEPIRTRCASMEQCWTQRTLCALCHR